MRIGSLFSGTGMLDVAVSVVFDAEVAWHSEVNPAAAKILEYQCPGTPNLGDITAVDWSQVEPVDILCGGFPCQDVSCAGRRAGLGEGTRSGLWSYFAYAIAVLKPPIVVIENVRGLLSAKAKMEEQGGQEEADEDVVESGEGNLAVSDPLRAAGAVLGDLASLGYDAQWTTLAASAVGAPHKRERVFILATRRGAFDAGCDGSGCIGCDNLCPCHQLPDAADGGLGGATDARGQSGEGLRPGPEGCGGSRGADVADPEGDGWNQGWAEPTGFEWRDLMLPSAVMKLLPTPVTTDSLGARNSTAYRHDKKPTTSIADTLTDALWKVEEANGRFQIPEGPMRGERSA